MGGIDPMDEVEMKAAMRSTASIVWSFYKDLRDQGFEQKDALTLTGKWLASVSSGGRPES